MFSISDNEFEELLRLFLKFNPLYTQPKQIKQPYPYFDSDLDKKLQCDPLTFSPRYEYTLMSLLAFSFAKNRFTNIFGSYYDYLSYVPTSFEREIDIVLMFNNPHNDKEIIAYNIIEVKRDKFDEKGLQQLLQYEEWFTKKKVNGDSSMLRTTAIAKSFDASIIEYLKKRKYFEGKNLLLLEYKNSSNGLMLYPYEY